VTGIAQRSILPHRNVDQIVVEYCNRLARIVNALNKDQVITLAEDLVHQTKLPAGLNDFNKSRGIQLLCHDDTQKVVVGNRWCKQLLERNHDIIKR
jgi:hypothetical protein